LNLPHYRPNLPRYGLNFPRYRPKLPQYPKNFHNTA
jgi:hypothetical protein